MEERRFVCKYCNKRFPCGMSLGGHIRTHMTEERSNVDSDMFKLDGVRKKKRDLWSEEVVGKKTMRFVYSDDANLEQKRKFCKECGKGFPSLKALYGHMACHSEKEKRTNKFEESEKKKLQLVMDTQFDTEISDLNLPRRSNRMRFKTLNLPKHSSSSSVVPLANDSSPMSEVEEVAECLMMLSRDSSFKGNFASITQSSNNNSVIVEENSSFLDAKINISNGNNDFAPNDYDLVEKKLIKGIKLKSAEIGASDNSDSKCFRYISHNEFKRPMVRDKSQFFEDYDVESRKIMNRRRSKYTETTVNKFVIEDLDYDRKDGSTRNFDSRKRGNYVYDSLGHNLVGVSSKISNGFVNDEVYGNGRKDWMYEYLEGERDNGSYDSKEESNENSSETDYFPALRSHSNKTINGKRSKKTKMKLKSKKFREHECPICYKIFRSGQALGGHKRSHFIGGSEENSLVIKKSAVTVSCLIDLNLPAPVDE